MCEIIYVKIERQAGSEKIPKNTDWMEVEPVWLYRYKMLFGEFTISYIEFVLKIVRLKIWGKGEWYKNDCKM